jgi:hypothetical protein
VPVLAGRAAELGRSTSKTTGAALLAIKELVALIQPPATPIDATGNWAEAEQEIGCVFPADFKELIRLYGTGQFFGIWISNPLQPWGRDSIRNDIARFRELREALEFDLPLFPERPGLLPWGNDSNGHLYCWWTAGPADGWTVAQVAHDEEETPHHASVPITAFLAAYVQNQYPAMLGGRVFTAADRKFEPGIPWLESESVERSAAPDPARDCGSESS